MITVSHRRAVAALFTLGILSMAACTVESGEGIDESNMEAASEEALGVEQRTGRTSANDGEQEEATTDAVLQTYGDDDVWSDKSNEPQSLIEQCGGGPCGGGGTSSGGTSSGGTSSGGTSSTGPYGSFFCPFGCNSVNCQTYQCVNVGFMSCSCRPW